MVRVPKLAVLLCLVALLLVSLPCAMALPAPARHCADCCAPHSFTAPAACCNVTPQPLEQTAALQLALPPAQSIPVPADLALAAGLACVTRAQNLPPPPLSPQLRI